MADIEKRDWQIDRKVQETLECISPMELSRFQTEAWQQAEKETFSLRGPKSHVLAAAKEKLFTLSDPEQKPLFEVAKAAMRASIGNLLGENHPGFHRAVDNQLLKEVQERYPIHTPLTDLWKKRVKTEADRILKIMVIRNYGLLKSQTVRDSP